MRYHFYLTYIIIMMGFMKFAKLLLTYMWIKHEDLLIFSAEFLA